MRSSLFNGEGKKEEGKKRTKVIKYCVIIVLVQKKLHAMDLEENLYKYETGRNLKDKILGSLIILLMWRNVGIVLNYFELVRWEYLYIGEVMYA